jgi:phosphopantetheine--protein transferase-like protein
MNLNSIDNYIRCCFDEAINDLPDLKDMSVQFYLGQTEDLIPLLPMLRVLLSQDERLRADKFHFESDRNTYVLCHSLLRKVISNKLLKDPSEVKIIYDANKKPWLNGNPLFFNLSHTRDAFAFAISDNVRIGIDLENFDRNIDFKAIIRTFFSIGEEKFILEDQEKSRDRFFLLWTRKEAFLKALGTGIIDTLQDVEVFRNENYIKRESFKNILDENYFCDHFIYSMKADNNYLSVAVPAKSKILIYHLTPESLYNKI